MLLAGCATGPSSGGAGTVTPDLHQYSDAFQARAADELSAIDKPGCARQQTKGLDQCSALRRLVPDHLTLRDRIRALENGEAGDDGSGS
jgi:hypothetical protein